MSAVRIEIKVKVILEQATKGLDVGVVGQRYAPVALPPEKTRYPLYRRLGWPQGRTGQVWKILPPPPTGIRSPDRPDRSESLYRLSSPGLTNSNTVSDFTSGFTSSDLMFYL